MPVGELVFSRALLTSPLKGTPQLCSVCLDLRFSSSKTVLAGA